jgi:hypothetical protein
MPTPIVILACTALQRPLSRLLPEAEFASAQFLDTGLHQIPKQLTIALQAALEAIEIPSRVMLGYGLCGNGLAGLRAGAHTLIMPRSDDCIALLFGSYAAFRQEFDSQPGTYYVTPEWLEAGISPLHEHRRLQACLGEEKARWVMDQQYGHYKRLLYLAATPEDQAAFRPQALQVAEYCQRWGFIYEERLGSDLYLHQLVQAVRTLDGSTEDFLLVSSGGVIDPDAFQREA